MADTPTPAALVAPSVSTNTHSELVEEARRLAAAATPGPWRTQKFAGDPGDPLDVGIMADIDRIVSGDGFVPLAADATFIARARTLVVELADALAARDAAPSGPEWGDEPLPEDAAIKAAHPTRTERHDLYAEAMRLVGARRSKGGLVELVNWLLARDAAHRAEVERRCLIPACTLPPCDLAWGHDGDMHANAGDGFYAREHVEEHHRRQRERALPAAEARVVEAAKERDRMRAALDYCGTEATNGIDDRVVGLRSLYNIRDRWLAEMATSRALAKEPSR